MKDRADGRKRREAALAGALAFVLSCERVEIYPGITVPVSLLPDATMPSGMGSHVDGGSAGPPSQ
jgi:hypothetical protein